jgi:DNA-binding SARP family transcriptional activator
MPAVGAPVRLSHGHKSAASYKSPTPRLTMYRGFQLTVGDVRVQLSPGPQRLLAFLALHDNALPRTFVAGVLWADVVESRACGNLRSALWRLRTTGAALVGCEYDYLRLDPRVVVDVREATRLAKIVVDPAADVAGLTFEELPLAGDLLPGWYDDWVVFERERHRQICLHALETLCGRWTEGGHYAKAVMAGLAAVAGEPIRESAHRALIRAYLAQGNPGEAVRQYRRCSQMLHNELRIQPSAQITDLVKGLSVTPG